MHHLRYCPPLYCVATSYTVVGVRFRVVVSQVFYMQRVRMPTTHLADLAALQIINHIQQYNPI